ncbi:MAG: porin [Vicinamibacterales bacterium]
MCIAGFRAAARGWTRLFPILLVLGLGLTDVLPAAAAEGSNEALLRLLQVLRDRGSITAQEYDEIRLLADAPEAAAPPGPAAAPTAPAVSTTAAHEAEQDKAIAEVKAATTGTPAPVVSRALAGKWYERLSMRGYTQFRREEVFSARGGVLEVPADRSVNPNESFGIRRGRFVISGDLADHLSLYAQMDFAGSAGTGDFVLQTRDLYGDVWLDRQKTWRVRLGQSKVPFGWVNLQSSQNRGPLERPDALNSAVEGERDLGGAVMWASTTARQRFRDLTALGLKGSGDYGVAALGVYSGQGLNRPDQNADVHAVARVSYPFKAAGGQFFELGAQAYLGRFVTTTQPITSGGATFTPTQPVEGVIDQRVALTAVVYPQPFGFETEWTIGEGPQLADDLRSIAAKTLKGGYFQANYRLRHATGTWFPFARWNYYDGARKFGRNAPRDEVNEIDLGVEFARWAEVEITGIYTRTFRRTRTSTFPYQPTRDANRLGFQVQWNY